MVNVNPPHYNKGKRKWGVWVSWDFEGKPCRRLFSADSKEEARKQAEEFAERKQQRGG